MAAEIEFCLLGPLIVRRREVAVTVPRGKQRVILAMLLLNAGRVVHVDEFAETLWVSGPPPSRQVAVQNYVMRLRNTLGDAGRARIITQPSGYLIRVQAEELDLFRFEALLGATRTAARDGWWERAAAYAREALELWRGEPLTGVGCEELTAREAPRLAELRLQALQLRIDADLHLGRHAQVITELQQMAGAYPLRERLHSQLMLALYRDGRQAEALAAYQDARTMLLEELGIEPGPELRRLHEQILAADAVLAVPAPVRPGQGEPAGTAPRELPPAVPGFTGRTAELQALTRLLDRPAGEVPGAVMISAIGGTAGVGKTALAVQWAHQVAGRFPGGQLYVNLRGYDPDQPMLAVDALARFLRALGVPGQDIPPDEDERAARYRTLLAGKKMLIVLDNAGSAEQVRPLLPGTPDCVVVVTSRDALAGLVARHGATRLDLDLLPANEAAALLRSLIGARVDHDPQAAAELAGQCCRLPLALRVAAELAAARPDVPLARLVAELTDRQRRLDLLDAGGDIRTAVRVVFSWSYRHLDDDAARAFRLAGMHPGPDFDPYAVAALTGMILEQASTVLDTLGRAHLIQPAGTGRYGMHDLLRAYARELTARDEEKEQDAALTRLFDHYLHTAATAMDALYPAERDRRPRIPAPDTPVPPVSEPTAARAWLDAERADLVAVAVYAAGHSWPSHATRLSATLFRYLHTGGHHTEAVAIHSHAGAAAQRTADRAGEATALNYLGAVHRLQGSYQQAADVLRQALALFRQTGDRAGQARALGNLGIIDHTLCRYREAIGFQRQALSIFRETGDLFGEAITLSNLGISEERLGRYDMAARHYRQTMVIAADIGARDLECLAPVNLGIVLLRQGRYQQAVGYLHRALELSREIGYREVEADALARIGELCLRQARPDEATRHLQEALALHRELGDRSAEADALTSLGEVLLATGQPDHARAEYAAALALTAQTGDKYQQARAHRGLGKANHASGDTSQARRHWQQALTLFTELGTPEAEQVRAEMPPAGKGKKIQQGSTATGTEISRLQATSMDEGPVLS